MTVTAMCCPVRLATAAMGTRFELLLHGADERMLRAAGEEAIEEIERWHARLSRFERSSEASRIASAGGSAVPVDRQVLELFTLCEAVRIGSEGAFDVTVGSGVVAIDAGASTVALTATQAGENAGLDFGGVAKGFALDRAAEILRGHGVGSALLHGGTSTIAAIGRRPDGGPWRVVIEGVGGRDPRRVDLADLAVSVSSDAVQGPHIADPRARRPVARSAVAACVHASAAQTDAWSTALYVEGRLPAGAGVEGFIWEGGAWRDAARS